MRCLSVWRDWWRKEGGKAHLQRQRHRLHGDRRHFPISPREFANPAGWGPPRRRGSRNPLSLHE